MEAVQAIAEMITTGLGAERAASTPCLATYAEIKPFREAQSVPNFKNMPSVAPPAPEVPRPTSPIVELLMTPGSQPEGPQKAADWRVVLAKKIWGMLWVKGRRRWTVLVVTIGLMMAGLAFAIHHAQQGRCDCKGLQRQIDQNRKWLQEQRQMLALHQRWLEELRRGSNPSRSKRSIVPSVPVMLELLAKGYSRADVLNYFRQGRIPTEQPTPAADEEPLPEEIDKAKAEPQETATKIGRDYEGDLDNNVTEFHIGGGTQNAITTAHMALSAATLVMTLGIVFLLIARLAACRLPANQNAPEPEIPLQDLGVQREADEELAEVAPAGFDPVDLRNHPGAPGVLHAL